MPNPHAHQPLTPDQIRELRASFDESQPAFACRILGYDEDDTRRVIQALNIINLVREWESGRREPSPAYDRVLRSLTRPAE